MFLNRFRKYCTIPNHNARKIKYYKSKKVNLFKYSFINIDDLSNCVQVKTLEIEFEDNKKFTYLAEYLRVYSPAASAHVEKQHNIPYAPNKLVPNRSGVEIMQIERIGSYALAFVS